jgi:hypothetical protein
MYVNAKMTPVKTLPGIRGEGMGERRGRGNSSMMYLIHCKNLHKYYKVLPPSTTIKKNKVWVLKIFSQPSKSFT